MPKCPETRLEAWITFEGDVKVEEHPVGMFLMERGDPITTSIVSRTGRRFIIHYKDPRRRDFVVSLLWDNQLYSLPPLHYSEYHHAIDSVRISEETFSPIVFSPLKYPEYAEAPTGHDLEVGEIRLMFHGVQDFDASHQHCGPRGGNWDAVTFVFNYGPKATLRAKGFIGYPTSKLIEGLIESRNRRLLAITATQQVWKEDILRHQYPTSRRHSLSSERLVVKEEDSPSVGYSAQSPRIQPKHTPVYGSDDLVPSPPMEPPILDAKPSIPATRGVKRSRSQSAIIGTLGGDDEEEAAFQEYLAARQRHQAAQEKAQRSQEEVEVAKQKLTEIWQRKKPKLEVV
ncbi:hypothetical protein JAAARDRAFT_209920 [Jaapia argillacea MUCL 33604]|uniref:Uncharacterized protein n=1 Tax=Jaapia argillacea MUCL 33604 TaxID=933084 RepID=A0A067PIA4_9AGAM|nr:hypothetical protein JAAARDRAFT_209920 [Jaapia argillacea MUCL 33604]